MEHSPSDPGQDALRRQLAATIRAAMRTRAGAAEYANRLQQVREQRAGTGPKRKRERKPEATSKRQTTYAKKAKGAMESQSLRSAETFQSIGNPTQTEAQLNSVGATLNGPTYASPVKPLAAIPVTLTLEPGLTPRMRQTLSHLLSGDSEKQIAGKLRISRHTVHVYVKQIYRRYNVNSRGELFARWVRQ
jgi:DNA-binding CsgD family transcriptional regulator